MKVSIIGMGYVGLVTGACLAEKGHQVTCVDVDAGKVDKINKSIPTLYEKGLEELLKRNIGKNLHATTDITKAVLATDISLIAVGTPYLGDEIDLSYVMQAAQQIGKALKDKNGYHLVVVKSTVIPGTTDDIVLPILEKSSGKKAGADFGVGMNPEFLREGEAVNDFMFPDRIVLGGIDTKSIRILEKLYDVFPGAAKIKTNCKTAEMIKYTSNALLATMISFSNEIANLCSATGGIDASEVMKAVHLDKRLSPIMADGKRIIPDFTTYLEAGCGFGGSCFPKDIKALNSFGTRAGNRLKLLEAVIEINENQPQKVIDLLRRHFPDLKGLRVAVLGLAFKPDTDDVRESPAIPIIERLLAEGAKVKAYDPVANKKAQELLPGNKVIFCEEISRSIENVDAILLITRWKEFERIPELLKKKGKAPWIIDARRMLPKDSVPKYDGIGL